MMVRLGTTLGMLLMVESTCQAFRPTAIVVHRFPTTELFAKRQSKKKGPRFGQAAHGDSHRYQQPQQFSKRKPKKKPAWQQKQFEEDDDAGRYPRSADIDAIEPEVWKTGKSIEDLEASLTKRYGTDLHSCTADPGEYEMVDDDDDYDEKGGTGFRGKRVLDPWQREEQKERLNKAELAKRRRQGGVFGSAHDASLHRVKRNQQKLQQQQSKSERNKARTTSIDWLDFVEQSDQHTFDYYDEDDEGYEVKTSIDGEDDNVVYDVGKLISPRPVASDGLGEEETATSESQDQGFFFNPNAASDSNMEDQQQEAELPNPEVKQMKKSQYRPVPVVDGYGDPVFLTVDQAKANFEESIEDDDDAIEDETTPEDIELREARLWEELGIVSPQLLQNLEAMGCPSPLAVQRKACPSILTGTDVLVGTYTGSGKTLAFLVPLAQRLLMQETTPSDGIKVLVVAPGRELASQIAGVARQLLEGTDLGVSLAIGGTTFMRNLDIIRKRKPTILVCTPGRIAEFIVGKQGEKKGRVNAGSLETLVLDEFDALLEYQPHRDPTTALVGFLKRRHGNNLQSVLCSATASDMVDSEKLDTFLRPGYAEAFAESGDKTVTSGGKEVTRVSKTVIHGVVHVEQKRMAVEMIRRVLHTEPYPQQVLIFADNSKRVESLVESLAKNGIVAAALHGGEKSQKMDRAEVSKALRDGYVGVVVATELAARGLDAPLLTHVINMDLPTDASHYAHRAGRCGRGGRPGVVINFTKGPKDRSVPHRLADKLGIDVYAVDVRDGKLNIVDPTTLIVDGEPWKPKGRRAHDDAHDES